MIPLLPNIGYAEIGSAGTINDEMGSAKSQLPIQFFRLTANISGNITIANDSSHKKIIIDTNGKTIINSSGSPLTSNSDINVELKGSGNIQSTLKTFTSAVSSTSNTGTTTISAADNSTMVVAGSTTDTTQNASVNVTTSRFGNGNTAAATVSFTDLPSAFQNLNSSLNGGGNFASGVVYTGDTVTSTTSNPNSVSLSMNRGCGSSTATTGGGFFQNFFQNCASGNPFQIILRKDNHTINFNSSEYADDVTRRCHFKLAGSRDDRLLTFTNNLAIAVVLSGGNPYTDITVNAGATAVVTRSSSSDGAFSITGTISGSDGSSQPFAMSAVNNGSGNLTTSAYTGTFSASAF